MPKGLGYKKTGGGPKYGSFSFPSGAGFTHSGTSKQNVKGYSRSAPKRKFASGGMVTAPMASSSSALTRRTKPVTGFDKEAGGRSPLRPGFNMGGKACYAEGGKVKAKVKFAEGGKVNTVGQAIGMVKRLMAQGNSASDAAEKAARRFGVDKSQLKTGPTGGGGLPAEKQMLARGGMAKMVGRVASAAAQGFQQGQTAAVKRGPPQNFVPAPQGQKAPGRAGNHMVSGYGSFGRRPVVG